MRSRSEGLLFNRGGLNAFHLQERQRQQSTRFARLEVGVSQIYKRGSKTVSTLHQTGKQTTNKQQNLGLDFRRPQEMQGARNSQFERLLCRVILDVRKVGTLAYAKGAVFGTIKQLLRKHGPSKSHSTGTAQGICTAGSCQSLNCPLKAHDSLQTFQVIARSKDLHVCFFYEQTLVNDRSFFSRTARFYRRRFDGLQQVDELSDLIHRK